MACRLDRIRRARVRSRLFALVFPALLLAGCGAPAERVDRLAARLGLVREVVAGRPFQHVVYRNRLRGGDVLHVYIGGDGRPWTRVDRIADDPDSPRSVMLDLLALDARPGLYLGRPCYHGLAKTAPCTPWHWTMGRYSDIVVDSMARVLRDQLDSGDYKHLVLIGHSGGGALAMLLAARFVETDTLVTLAGNLDTDAWADLHDYSPLVGSLNPASQPPLSPAIRQYHLAAGRDRLVPAGLIERVVSQWPNARVIRFDDFDHRCCWQRVWPAMLDCIERRCRYDP